MAKVLQLADLAHTYYTPNSAVSCFIAVYGFRCRTTLPAFLSLWASGFPAVKPAFGLT
jgi:hypothetical protein